MYIEKKKLKIYISYWLASMFWIVSIMIIVGGLTRLTDSGLSITEWELFSGFLPPLNETQWNIYFNLYKKIPEYKLQNYLMSLDEFRVIFWWEFIHRFMGKLIGIFFILPLTIEYFMQIPGGIPHHTSAAVGTDRAASELLRRDQSGGARTTRYDS